MALEFLLPPFFGRSSGSDPLFRDAFDIVALADQTSMSQNALALTRTNVDWLETAEAHVFKVDVPGFSKEDVKVTVEEQTLQLRGQRSRPEVGQSDTWHRTERTFGQFMRKFRLPKNADIDGICAKVENGLLIVTVPKIIKPILESVNIQVT